MTRRTVVACSGGSSSTMAVAALARGPRSEVVAVTLDLGQGRDLEEVRERAIEAGAVRAHVLDAREEFAAAFVLPALQAGVQHEGLPTAILLAQPLIAKKLLDVAYIEGASGVAHGCREGDAIRMENSLRSLDPRMPIVGMGGVPAPIGYVRGNLWGRCTRYDGNTPLPLTGSPSQAAADVRAIVDIAFERGAPCEINGVPLSLTELIDIVSIIAAQHGVGRTATPGDRSEPGRRVDDAPAATVLHAAHDALEAMTMPANLIDVKNELRNAYTRVVQDGSWFTKSREALDAFNRVAQDCVTGTVRVELQDGRLAILECASRPAVDGAIAAASLHGVARHPVGTT